MEAAVEQALAVVMVLSLVPLSAIAVGAGAVSLLQAMLQVQEQSIVHLARLGIVAALLLFGGAAAFAEVERLFVAVVNAASQPSGEVL